MLLSNYSFERGLNNVTATYVKSDNGLIKVVNSGTKGNKVKTAIGKAKFKDGIINLATIYS